MLQIGVVADDFTGTASAGMMMAKANVKTGLFLNAETMFGNQEAKELEAIYVSTSSRALPPENAYEEVKKATLALKKAGARYFSKKIDTTMRGGIGHEVDAMLDVLGEDVVAVMVTSMPPSRRICVGGYSIIDSVILNETSVAQDVKTPVAECYVPAIIEKQTKRKVDLIPITVVQRGIEALKQALEKSRQAGTQFFILDAASMDHEETIARACVELKWNILAVDPGAFTMKLAVTRGIASETAPQQESSEEPAAGKAVLIIAGSANPYTKKQMELLLRAEPESVRISVSPNRLLEDGEAHSLEVEQTAAKLRDILSAPDVPKVLLVETALHDSLVNLKEEDEKHGYAPGESSARINRGLAEIADQVLRGFGKERIAGLLLTGGDTMESVCKMIGTTYIRAIDNIVPQIDVGRLAGAYDGMPVVVKGGFCGYDEVGIDIVNRILLEANR